MRRESGERLERGYRKREFSIVFYELFLIAAECRLT
jgi:hypothetical protein